ncbi:MAG: hypothetical protein AAGG69_11890 [Pseudomonadota bacterium]
MKKTAILATAFAALSASAAMAGYEIYQDDAYPSVMFVEIEGGSSADATVISAPTSVAADPALPTVSGGNEGQQSAVSPTPSGGGNEVAPQSEQQTMTTEDRVERNLQLGDTQDQAVERAFREEELDTMVIR